MRDILSRIDKKKRMLDKHKPFSKELVKQLEDWLKIELTYSSNAIEGNTLSRIETAEAIEKGLGAVISGKSLKDQLEAINHAKAVEFIKQLAQERKSHQIITEKDILNIHRIILTGIQDEWAGKYRRTDIFIRGSDVQFPHPFQVPRKMKEFIGRLSGLQEGHPVTYAADAHFKFVTIHPFIDGNGRVTRLLMNLILVIHGYPMAVIRSDDMILYLQSFEKARIHGNLSAFYDIVYTAVERSLDLYLEAAKGKQPAFSSFIPQKTKKESLLKIGELAQATGESVPTIRYWTKEGLLNVSSISKGGYQLYDREMIQRAKKIRALQRQKRLTIEEIRKQIH